MQLLLGTLSRNYAPVLPQVTASGQVRRYVVVGGSGRTRRLELIGTMRRVAVAHFNESREGPSVNLAELIASSAPDRSDLTLSRACGGHPTRETFRQMRAAEWKAKEFPKRKTIRALADVLNVPERRVIVSMAETLGFVMKEPSGQLVSMLPPEVDDLDYHRRNTILSVAHDMLAAQQAEMPTLANVARKTPGAVRAPKPSKPLGGPDS